MKSNTPFYRWSDIARLAWQHKKNILLAQLIAVIAVFVTVPLPLLMPLLIDEVLLNHPAQLVGSLNHLLPPAWQQPVVYIALILFITLLLRLWSLGLGVWQMRQFTRVSKDVICNLRQCISHRLQNVSMAEYETLGSGKVISHLITDLDTLDQFIGASLSKFVVAVLTLLVTAGVLFWLHWPLAVLILVIHPIVVYSTIWLGRKVKRLKKEENQAYASFQQSLTEILASIQQIRAYNREQYYLGKVRQAALDIRDRASEYAWKTDAATRFSMSIFLLGFDSFRAIGMVMVLFSDLQIGAMLAVFGYLWFMLGPMQEILNIQYAYHSAQAALQRVNQLFQLDEEPHYPHLKNPFDNNDLISIRLENIAFSYGRQGEVLHNINLTIPAGKKIALVGGSGGGKTTLVHILLGLYVPNRGQVYFNHIPIDQIGMDVVREHVITVLQHPALFNDSLRNNLTLGRDISDEQLWQALEIAQLAQDVRDMPEQLETLLGQGGLRLSGGQRQRVAVARMVLAQPKVVILDEATSALDTQTEFLLHQALQKFLQNRTTLIIAHRLSAVKQADYVVVLENGRLVEQGEHANLLKNNGMYQHYFGQLN
jgi:ATP-binding cassette subfamily C protein